MVKMRSDQDIEQTTHVFHRRRRLRQDVRVDRAVVVIPRVLCACVVCVCFCIIPCVCVFHARSPSGESAPRSMRWSSEPGTKAEPMSLIHTHKCTHAGFYYDCLLILSLLCLLPFLLQMKLFIYILHSHARKFHLKHTKMHTHDFHVLMSFCRDCHSVSERANERIRVEDKRCSIRVC